MQALGFLFLTIWFYRELWLFRLEGGDPGQKVTKFSIVLYAVEILARLPLAGKVILKASGRVVDFIRWSFMQAGGSKQFLDVADERGDQRSKRPWSLHGFPLRRQRHIRQILVIHK